MRALYAHWHTEAKRAPWIAFCPPLLFLSAAMLAPGAARFTLALARIIFLAPWRMPPDVTPE